MAKKEKKEKKAKKSSAGKIRALVGALIAVVLFVGVGICDALTTGKKLFSFVSTGSVMDRFDKSSAETSRKETEEFYMQAANLFWFSADQKYTSYTMTYTVNAEAADYQGKTYTNVWREVSAAVDKDYTVYTVVERYAEALTYRRTVKEYVLCKSGENKNRAWVRKVNVEQSASDVDLLSDAKWVELEVGIGAVQNEVLAVVALFYQAEYGDYNFVDASYNFSVSAKEHHGEGVLTPGLKPSVSFAYIMNTEREDTAYHKWTCSNLNATKAIVPQSLLDSMGGAA